MLKSNNVEFTRAYMEFSDAIMKNLVADSEDNVFVSPMSIIIALAMLLECTEGETRQEIVEVIGTQNENRLIHEMWSVLDTMSSGGAFKMANALIADQCLAREIKHECVEMLKNDFDVEFFAEKNAAQKINSWVNEKTNGMIPEIVDESIAVDTAIVNAVTFVGEWQKKYEAHDLKPDYSFKNNWGKEESVTMMCSDESLYLEDKRNEGFVKHYSCGFDFMALLPKKSGDNLREIASENLISNLCKLYERRRGTFVCAAMPEVRYGFMKNIVDTLRTMGIERVFSEKAELSPLTNSDGSIVTDVMHKTYVKVDAEGTKAAALTGVFYGLGMPEKIINLNRPYIFAIMHRATGLPIFVGLVNTVNGAK